RKFFNNCFDGALTCAGIVSGLFIVFLNPHGVKNTPSTVIIYGFATALAIGISGLWGAFLSEEAERKKKMADLRKEMVMLEEDKDLKSKEEDLVEEQELEDIQKAMIIPIKGKISLKKEKSFNLKKKKDKTIIEQAEDFATIAASLVDGLAPVLGSSLPLIPFFFGTSLTLFHFIFSYIILAGLLIYLGIFLGNISGGGKIKYALHLISAGIVTLLVSLLLGI
ncbi:MAG: VIT1/CCC1 transporter family protein, partial [Candidatus Lokiarchaeota archaeon]|nr:VIT1/CCC1 transporter family protein [Candidatus Lokiarchaeota archaeon]